MSKTIKRLFVIALMIFTLPIQAEIIALKPDAPERYIVVKGDTLWDIAGRFIGSPWKWPEIWHLNDQISNPHLIYPGDIIGLINIDGQTKLTVTQRGDAARTVKLNPDVLLSPTARIEPIEAAIPAIPLSAIEGYFKNHEILNKKELRSCPTSLPVKTKELLWEQEAMSMSEGLLRMPLQSMAFIEEVKYLKILKRKSFLVLKQQMLA